MYITDSLVLKLVHSHRQMPWKFRATVHVPVVLGQHVDVVKNVAAVQTLVPVVFAAQTVRAVNRQKSRVHNRPFVERHVTDLIKLRERDE